MKRIYSLILTLLIWVPLTAESRSIPGGELLNYFGANCKTQGSWTRAVLEDSMSLMDIIQEVSNDPDCTSAAGAIGQLGLLSNKIQHLQNVNYTKKRLTQLEAQEQMISSEILKTADPVQLGSLQYMLNAIMTEKASLMVDDDFASKLDGDNMGNIYSDIVLTANTVFSRVTANRLCTSKRPGILVTATSIAAAVGSAVTVANPALGLGLAAVTELIGITAEGVRKGVLARKLRRISDGSVALEGYRCALETLTNRWCELEDAETMLQFKSSNVSEYRLGRKSSKRNHSHDALQALSIFESELPIFIGWLERVRSGVPATTNADAGRQKNVFEREKMIKVAKSKGEGLFAEKEIVFSRELDPVGRWTILQGVIDALLNTSDDPWGRETGSVPHPLFDIYTKAFAPYFLLGLETAPTVDYGNGPSVVQFSQFNPFLQWPNGTYTPSLEIIKNQYSIWVEKAFARVNFELTQVLQPDAMQTLAIAFDYSDTRYGISPFEALNTLSSFLLSNRPENFVHNSYEDLYLKTLDVLETIKRSLDGYDGAAAKTLKAIYDSAQLESGTIVVQNRLETILKFALFNYLDEIDDNERKDVAISMATGSYLKALQLVSGGASIAEMKLEIDRAKGYALHNLESFVDVFDRNIKKALKSLNKKLQNKDQSQVEAYKKNRDELCILLASVPNWPRNVPLRYCEGAKLDSGIENGPASETVNKAFLRKDFRSRACTFRDFIRKSKIYEEWNVSQ